MFIKRETRAGKAYAYRMLLSLKILVTFTPDNCARCEPVLVRYNSIFCRPLSDVLCKYSGLTMEKKGVLPITDTAKKPVISLNFLVWKFCGKKLCRNCSFPQNFHTRKLCAITVFFAVRHILKNLEI